METCLRGFSFIPESKVEVIDLQYIEGGELSRAWKTSRRQRLKELETKIWDEFVKERDIVSSVCSDDPYLFLENLPEDTLKELMDAQLNKMKSEKTEEVTREINELKQQGYGDEAREPRETMVSFADEADQDSDMIQIFDDERDEASGAEQEAINNSIDSPPCTVRENQPDSSPGLGSPDEQVKAASEKSSENVRNMIETSIYCAKVKELQSKVNLELLAVITSLEAQDLNKIEPHNLSKLKKQCAEFCARFNRIYLYQLKRQVHDMTRHNNAALPFARHTFLRSQMTRAVSFQQNLLQSLQVFHKWFTQKAPLRECVESLKNFTQVINEGDELCPAELHNEELQQTCENLNGVLDEYLLRLNHFFALETASSVRSKRSQKHHISKKRSFGHCSKPGQKQNSEADARLSMYSLDTLRVNSKHSSFKEFQSGGTSKVRLSEMAASAPKPEENAELPQKKKTPRSRRPLMRAPGSQRTREKPRETDNISTMVEIVGTCASSYMSDSSPPRASPFASPRRPERTRARLSRGIRKGKDLIALKGKGLSPHRGKDLSPLKGKYLSPHRGKDLSSLKGKDLTPLKGKDLTPFKGKDWSPHKVTSRSVTPRLTSPRSVTPRPNRKPVSPPIVVSQEELKLSLHSAKVPSDTALSPVIKVQCEKKEKRPPSEENTPRCTPDAVGSSVATSRDQSPRRERKSDRKSDNDAGASCEVSRLLRKLCGSSGAKNERSSGAKNAQLLCVNGGSPRQPSTPQLLRILEETIIKKAPKPQFCVKPKVKDVDRFRLTFNVTAKAADALFQYRTKFVQHMLSSPMYANSAVGKPWEMIGTVSEQIINDILLLCAKEMQLEDFIKELYISETQ